MSYAELDRAARGVATRLRAAGVRDGAVVAVALDRGPGAIISLLGVLQAGAAYLPIDPHLPGQRIEFMLADASVVAVIAESVSAAPWAASVPLVPVAGFPAAGDPDAPGWRVEDEPNGDVPARGEADDIAYVMYTSGSTGMPKGVSIRHRSIIRLVIDPGFMRLGDDTRMLQAAPLGFDASTLEIWGPLLNGGCCVLHSEAIPTGPGIARTIHEHGVDSAWLTAALFNAIVDDDPRHLLGLRQLLTGGEALSVAHVRRALAALPDTTLINGYGPTECTTFATTYTIPRDLPADVTSIPIGRPINRTTVHVLDEHLEPVEAGSTGELCIGGDGLATGYLSRPELTAERFVQNPFGAPGERLYRTGDLVRMRPDGLLEYLGRRDAQVKIRGYRIEPGEIEAALARCMGVRACAVIPRSDGPTGLRLVAYVVGDDADVEPDIPAIRAALAEALPSYMVPSVFVPMSSLPITANGKLDRAALPAPSSARPALRAPFVLPEDALEQRIANIFSGVLGIDEVGALDDFFELGGNSLAVMQALALINEESPAALNVATFYDDASPRALARSMRNEDGHEARDASGPEVDPRPAAQAADEPIAIIGMAARLPGSSDVESLWDNLCAGREGITFFRDDELDEFVPEHKRTDPAYVRARGVIEGVEFFDAAFFGISPREADVMDPQQRVFLELCWQCMERAGHPPVDTPHTVGVFAGVYNASYYQNHVLAHPERIERLGEFQVMLANEKDYVATRVAHRLSLDGPAINLFTACSTSLVAICQAVESLRAGRCSMALAGGAAVSCPPATGYLYEEGSMLSPDGHTRTFDAAASGTVFSDGAAVVLLKRLSDAVADGDSIHAVIRGVAINNDGGSKASFTAPSVEGQSKVIAAALRDAGVDAASVGYVETHGTATPLGDPVEVEALTRAYRQSTDAVGFCRLGSIKTNIGHTVMAAGAAGVIKAALALEREFIPANLHFTAPNPQIDFARSPFIVDGKAADWPRGGGPRRAGVSSFGVGGTNAHVILEEAPALPPSEPAQGPCLLRLSAKSAEALQRSAENLADHLRAHPETNLADAAFTLRVGRRQFAHRLAVVAHDTAAAATALAGEGSPLRVRGLREEPLPPVAFMFPGQGAQYAGMGSGLYAAEPVFRAALDECFAALDGVMDVDLRRAMFEGDAEALAQTSVTQPALFCLEYAVARLWMARGLRPTALIGHSLGEFVAAAIAGVMDPADAARLVARRGALMQSQPPGRMMAVRLADDAISRILPADVSLAAVNAPSSCVVAGPAESLERLAADLEREGVPARLLMTSHAFHSAMMTPAVSPFEAEVRQVRLSAPQVPIVSCVTGAVLSDAEATDPGYWGRHLRDPVRFSPALRTILADGRKLLLECGPRATLAGFARQHTGLGEHPPHVVVSLGDSSITEAESVQLAAGKLWTLGYELGEPQDDARRRRIVLPTYPFERTRHWVSARQPSASAPRLLAAGEIGGDARVDASVAAPPAAPIAVSHTMNQPIATIAPDRVPALVERLRSLFEDISGVDMDGADPETPFVELGLDSLALTQAALQVRKEFRTELTFRRLMEDCRSLGALARHLDETLPPDPAADPAAEQAETTTPAPAGLSAGLPGAPGLVAPSAAPLAAMPNPAVLQAGMQVGVNQAAVPMEGTFLQDLIRQQMSLMERQLALVAGAGGAQLGSVPMPAAMPMPSMPASAAPPAAAVPSRDAQAGADAPRAAGGPQAPAAEPEEPAPVAYDARKAFGAIARIHTASTSADLTSRQRARLEAFIQRYVERTRSSKDYTQRHRSHLADPRVVNGFRPLLKEITYQIVVERSAGSRLWDLDGNEYVDALNGFGMSLFGWQPPFVIEALQRQLDHGYDIGPQHPLAGEVAALVCEMTGFDRAGLCNTGSEAVMGALRIARTVTGRSLIVSFSGAYHGIFDEVLVRGTKKLRAIPAAPGIMPNVGANVLVLEYGTPESMRIIRERADELAAVLVEPVQSRRPDFQPREFLRELREVTERSGTALVFDEIVTGFRAHPGGTQALFGVQADLATYGKVIGGGLPIGIIAGKRQWMDALDGGGWRYGDDSIPTVGVTYFAGTFVRHPLALAAAHAVLQHLKAQGPDLQATLNRHTASMCDELNAFCRERGAPIEIRHFSSVWKIVFTEEHPLQDLLFAMMRSRGVHILDNFPCFFTTAHTEVDFAAIKKAFKESVAELQEAEFLPGRRRDSAPAFDPSNPPVPGARLGRDAEGNPAWFVPNPDAPGKFLRMSDT